MPRLDWQEPLLTQLTAERSREDLIQALNLDSSTQLRRQFLRPALDLGLIEQTLPDKPKSRFQRFRLTERGRLKLRALQQFRLRVPQLREIISGAQTGVDRAALDAAIARGFPYTGWIPQGRLAEDGPIPDWYQLKESDNPNYAARTRLNVQDSDGTLILYNGFLSGGTGLTVEFCIQLKKPYYLAIPPVHKKGYGTLIKDILKWAQQYQVCRLNVAGPRESGSPGIYLRTRPLIESLLDQDRVFGRAAHALKISAAALQEKPEDFV